MLSTSGCVVSAVSSITGLLTITYTSIHGKKRAEIRKSQWSILFVFAYFCAGMGGASERFSFVYLRWYDYNGHQCANRTCGVRSTEPIAVSTQCNADT